MSQTIIITGTSSGIGLALGNYLYEKGYNVYGLSRSVPKNANFLTIPTNITNEKEVDEAIDQILSINPRIDLLINNAGKGMVGPVENAKKDEILNLFTLNIVAPIYLISKVLPIMREVNKGKIFNISSIGSEMGLPFRGFYSGSKSALDMITESLRYELKNTDIEVCTINLGDIRTNIADHRIKSSISDIYSKDFKKVYTHMNTDVNNGLMPDIIAPFVEKLLIQEKKLKPHYYFGTTIQKLSRWVKFMIPQTWFEKIIIKYSGL